MSVMWATHLLVFSSVNRTRESRQKAIGVSRIFTSGGGALWSIKEGGSGEGVKFVPIKLFRSLVVHFDA